MKEAKMEMETKEDQIQKEKIIITNNDLFHKKYSMDILEHNIKHLNKKTLLCEQNLTADFCIKHILDMDIDNGSEDSYIYDKNYILDRQEHISEEEFDKAFDLYYVE